MAKKTCPECKKTYNSRFFKYNRVKKDLLCKNCSKRIGQNIFYNPEIKGAKKRGFRKIRLRRLQNDEKSFLYHKISEEEARKRIKEIDNLVKSINNKNYREETKKVNNNLNKKLVEGLKNY